MHRDRAAERQGDRKTETAESQEEPERPKTLRHGDTGQTQRQMERATKTKEMERLEGA